MQTRSSRRQRDKDGSVVLRPPFHLFVIIANHESRVRPFSFPLKKRFKMMGVNRKGLGPNRGSLSLSNGRARVCSIFRLPCSFSSVILFPLSACWYQVPLSLPIIRQKSACIFANAVVGEVGLQSRKGDRCLLTRWNDPCY